MNIKRDKDKKDQAEVVEIIQGTLPGDRAIRRRRKRRVALRRALGIPGIFSIAYGNLGASIYFALGVTAAYALGATPIVFMIAALFFIFTALAYAEGAAAIPEAGGSSSFARRGFNEAVSFVAGWCLILAYTAAIAISSYTAISYLGNLAPLAIVKEPFWHTMATGILLLFLMVINIVGVRKSSILNVLLAGIDVSTQGFLVLLGVIFFFSFPALISTIHLGIAPTWQQLAGALFLVTISFTGIETVSNMAEESKTPETTIPNSMWWSAGIIIFLFLGLSTIALNAMPVSYQIEGYIYAIPERPTTPETDTLEYSEKLVYYKPGEANRQGTPVANALVTVGERKEQTDESGRFRITGLGFREYILEVRKGGYFFEPIVFNTMSTGQKTVAGKWSTELVEKYSSKPLLGIAEKMPYFSDFLKWWVSILGFTILVIAANASLLGVSRVVFSMGTYKQIPPLLAHVHPRFRTPYVAIVIFTVIAFFIALQGNVEKVINLYAFAAMITYTIAHASIIAMRIRHPNMKRPFRIPFNIKIRNWEIPITSIIGFVAFFTLWILVNVREQIGREFGIPFILIGILTYIFYRNSQGLSLTETIDIKKRR